jgi:CBS domain-containing protein
MLCREIMQRPVRWVSEHDSIAHAARIMRSENIGFLPVTSSSGTFMGTLTDRDIVVRAVADEWPATTPVAAAMTHETVRCAPDDDLIYAEGLMRTHSKSRIVCTDADGHIAGIISIGDLAASEDGARVGETLKQITSRQARHA